MAKLSFKDRFLTPPVARTMLAPSSILLAGAGTALAIATGLPLVAAPLLGAAAWVARVLSSVPRNRTGERIDPFTLPDPWRGFVVEALKAQVRYGQVVQSAGPGAIRDRLQAIGERIDDGVQEAWRIARRGAQLVEARRSIEDDSARRALAALPTHADPSGTGNSAEERTAAALRAQIETAERLDKTIADARSQLQVLDARLDESVARATELSVQVSTADELGGFGADVDGLVQEMEALRQALEETTGQSGSATA